MPHQYILKIIILLFICCIVFQLDAQEVKVDVKNQPLNKVFIELRDNYGIQFSFDDNLLSNCLVSDSGTYDSPAKAISNLIKNCKLDYEKTKGVFIIYEARDTDDVKRTKEIIYTYSGRITDQNNTEPLPFSNLQFHSTGMISDVNGNFSFRSKDSLVLVHISHVGYYQLNTLLKPGINKNLKMNPTVIGLKEVVIDSEAKTYSTHIGEQSGMIKLNHQIASFLPGNNDNTIFNLLRLQPGVLAAAEQSNDYIIWGSYKGQNLVLFDGIPLFNVSSLNEEMGVINPLLVKDVEILKGGYNAHLSGRVSGAVNITGNSGNPNKFGFNLNINNQAASGLINIPIANTHALQLSYRQSYYNLLNWDKILNNKKDEEKDYYDPDYSYRDINVKFSGRTKNGDNFYLSLLGNSDDSDYLFSKEYNGSNTSLTNEIERQQLGGTFFFNKNWNRGGSTNTSVVYSSLNTNSFNSQEYSFEDSVSNKSGNLFIENSISELSVKTDHTFPTVKNHSIVTGLEYIYNTSGYQEDSSNISQKDVLEKANRISYYLKDYFTLTEIITIHPGIRLDFPLENLKPYFQPRINVTIKPTRNFNINLAWGMYNQFISENALVDNLGNYRYLWNICDNEVLSVLQGMHYLAGISYNDKGFIASVEGYYKITDDLSRFVQIDKDKQLIVSHGEGRSYGLDFYLKKEFKKHEFWLAYTISKTEELFDYFKTNEYQLAPQDQRHEVKGAVLLNFYPFFFSANYVYGSGLAFSSGSKDSDIQPYNRLDIAFMYRFNAGKLRMETGFSIINVLNIYNIRYNYYSVLPGGNTVYLSGVPFTPSAFFNFGF